MPFPGPVYSLVVGMRRCLPQQPERGTSMTISDLPAPVAAYIASTNASDIEALLATFSDDALVNDHRNEFADQDAIRNWAQREIIDDRVTMQVSSATCRGNSAA